MKKEVFVIVLLVMFFVPFASAGIGLSWDMETISINEGEEVCLSYGIYNPWPEDSWVKIELSDEFESIVESYTSQERLISKYTSSNESTPVKFCFEIPKIYEEDCSFFGLVCEQTCSVSEKTYTGEVEIVELIKQEHSTFSKSETSLALSAPLNIKVKCVAHPKNYGVIYLIIALIAFMLLLPKYLKNKRPFRK